MKNLKFSKMVATGNDFVVIDCYSEKQDLDLSKLAQEVCDRRLGIGADGLLVVEKSDIADLKMRIFNPDGSEPDMCGNGSRCFALYAKLKKLAKDTMTIETAAGLLSAEVSGVLVKINMTDPKDLKTGLSIDLELGPVQLHYINTGVPHIIYFDDDIDAIDLQKTGSSIRYHEAFQPEGSNVDFVQVKSKHTVLMRTYERGVEAETHACGTGAVASGIISSIIKDCESPVKVDTKGGVLTIYFDISDKEVTNVFLEGEAREVFTGEIQINH
ncbi:MAG: diaminopimelate epimerase [Candidatus Omnitrophota bacterium]